MSTTIHVEGISSKTNEDEVKSFFSFCGKIQTISVTPTDNDTQSAAVTFEKPAAAKTALLLDNTQLGPNSVKVTQAQSLDDLASNKATSAEEAAKDDHHIEQEEKPRSRIVAEYLAHGYTISDKAIEKALQFDQQNGVSNKFLATLKSFDEKTQATQKAQTIDSKFGISEKGYNVWRSATSYFDKVAGTPTGQKLRGFYEQGNKTVVDVHNEARHLADLKSGKQAGAAGASTEKPSVEEAQVEKIPGTEKTKCNCGAKSEACPCEPGKCGCTNCSKSDVAATIT